MNARRLLILLAALLVAVPLLSTSLFTIHETELGLVTRFGRPADDVAQPGLHFKWPWPIERVVRIDRRLLVFDNEPAEMLTRDKRNVLIDSFALWRVAEPLRFVQTVGSRLEAEARLLDLISSELGAAIGSFPMESLINVDPEEVRLRAASAQAADAIRGTLLDSFGIELVDLAINGFSLPRQNRASVIDRMRAERGRIAAQYRSEGEEKALEIEAEATRARQLLLSEARSQAETIRGEAEAEALRVLSEAYSRDPELYRFLRSLESAEKILDQDTTIFLPSDHELLGVLNER
ncbi:MAG: protease modulator HflC [Acidobacteriota bacterium]